MELEDFGVRCTYCAPLLMQIMIPLSDVCKEIECLRNYHKENVFKLLYSFTLLALLPIAL